MLNALLFILSFFYLIMEYLFNVSLVSMVGQDTIQIYRDVDYIGRLISSFGASLLCLRLFTGVKLTRSMKIIVTALLPIVFTGTYLIQKELLDYITEVTPMESKRGQAYTYIYKKGVANGSLKFEGTPKEKSLEEEHVFNSSIIYWGVG